MEGDVDVEGSNQISSFNPTRYLEKEQRLSMSIDLAETESY
jgi:hypothetical protein